MAVGIRSNNELVRSSFSESFQRYLVEVDGWFAYLEDYRHALAHRIPLYVPPHVVRTADQGAYKQLEIEKMKSISDDAEFERLEAVQMALATFRPVVMHSYEEKAAPYWFHPQMIADFNTVAELGRKVAGELDGLAEGASLTA